MSLKGNARWDWLERTKLAPERHSQEEAQIINSANLRNLFKHG